MKVDSPHVNPDRTRCPACANPKEGVRIMLVEDNLTNLKLASLLLSKGGFQVQSIMNGKEAVEAFTASPHAFDLIFMDVQMPEMDGLDATRTIREAGFHQIPIVAMTANAMQGDRERCLEAGMNDYVAKPIRREEIFRAVEEWVLKRREAWT
jgi:two-component system, sensor histidine kinase and response regulator